MKSKINDQIFTQRHIYEVLEKNLDKWSGIEQFKASYYEFELNLKKIRDLEVVAGKDISELTGRAQTLRKDLLGRLVPVSGLMELYASDQGKKKLKKKLISRKDKITRLDGKELCNYIDFVADFGQKKLKKSTETKAHVLAEYGLQAEMVESLKSGSEEYKQLWENLNSEQVEIQNGCKKIKKILGRNEKLIRKRFCQFMVLFKKDESGFYNSFEDALKPAS